MVCKSQGVDPFSSDCAAQAASVNPDLANCCLGEQNDQSITPTVQERAWSSPVWYRPEAIAAVSGSIERGTDASGSLDLDLELGSWPAGLDPGASDLSLRLSDDDAIYAWTVPANAWTAASSDGSTTWRFSAAAGGADQSATLVHRANGSASLHIAATGVDLRAANPTDHALRFDLQSGSYRSSYSRFWRADGGALRPAED
jgi:hypothetical protein